MWELFFSSPFSGKLSWMIFLACWTSSSLVTSSLRIFRLLDDCLARLWAPTPSGNKHPAKTTNPLWSKHRASWCPKPLSQPVISTAWPWPPGTWLQPWRETSLARARISKAERETTAMTWPMKKVAVMLAKRLRTTVSEDCRRAPRTAPYKPVHSIAAVHREGRLCFLETRDGYFQFVQVFMWRKNEGRKTSAVSANDEHSLEPFEWFGSLFQLDQTFTQTSLISKQESSSWGNTAS